MTDGGGRTDETSQLGSVVRSVGAVLAGLLGVIVLSLGTDVVMHATGIFPPWFQPMSAPLWVFATVYRIVYGIIGGYITARLAPRRRIKHALILGVVGFVLSVVGAVSTWNAGPEFGPRWYPLALILIAIPSAWLGGKLYRQRIRAS